MKMHMYRGSHLPLLMKAVQNTSGPILELGSGIYSTTYLHWVCFPTKRRVVTYENNANWYDFANLAIADFHEVKCVPDWNSLDLSEPWSVAFVDCEPAEKRAELIKQLTHAEYVVAHDTERRSERKYHFDTIAPLFKYSYRYDVTWPNSTVWSNVHDLTNFIVK